jgi:hypothetical protein
MSCVRSVIVVCALALHTLNCGALGAPARGDRDLPSTVLGGYAPVALQSSPTGSALLLSADDGSLAEPSSLLESDGRRALYMTHISRTGTVRIVRAIERQPRYLRFEPMEPVLEASLPWEQGAVRSPSVLRDGSTVWLFYAAGGAIGAARSTDGIHFDRESEPVLRPDGAHGESASIAAPSVVSHPSGGFVMAYASGGSLFLARAQRLPGPWIRVGSGAVITPGVITDAGLETLTDPALLIEQTATGRHLVTIAASSTAMGLTTSIVGFAAWDTGGSDLAFSRASRTLYSERTTSVSAGSFDRVDARTMLLWVTRTDRSRSVIGALVTPGSQRVANPFVP